MIVPIKALQECRKSYEAERDRLTQEVARLSRLIALLDEWEQHAMDVEMEKKHAD